MEGGLVPLYCMFWGLGKPLSTIQPKSKELLYIARFENERVITKIPSKTHNISSLQLLRDKTLNTPQILNLGQPYATRSRTSLYLTHKEYGEKKLLFYTQYAFIIFIYILYNLILKE